MAFDPTDEQKLAIKERGNVLVAAAAGSGKTAVLVERVIGMLDRETDPVDANRLLIVTFTNAAAAEMRARIERRLGEECAKYPDNIRLLRQKHLIPSAKICTIDSFCIDLIRENFDKCGVSPDFKMGDENAINALSKQVISELVGKYLENGEPLFREILDLTDSEFDESNFVETVEEIFRYSCQMPFPDAFLQRLEQDYISPLNAEHPWVRYVLSKAEETAHAAALSVAAAIDIAAEAELTNVYGAILADVAECLAAIEDAAKLGKWDEVYEELVGYKRPRLPSVRGALPEVSVIKSVIYDIDNDIDMLKKLLASDLTSVCDVNDRLSAPVRFLIGFVREYSEKLFEKQLKENLFTFYNTEQLALSMLCEYKDGVVTVKEDAKELFARFDEVLVDEYQDTNDLQDMLFRILSDREDHLFVVGDVKQSIYAFRGANPDNFLNKKNAAVYCTNAKATDAKKIILSKNFRSRKGVCDYINYFFRLLMTEQTGKIVYNSEEELVAGASFPENGDICTHLIINNNIRSEQLDENDHLVLEARAIAEHILQTMQQPPFLRGENGELRKAQYSDFVILMRSTKNKSAVVAQELRAYGIPVNYSQEAFLETLEISTFLSLLEIIDNPDNDISLLTAMMSPIFSFTAEELAVMRADKNRGSIISAVTFAAENGNEHAREFLRQIAAYRRAAVILPLTRLLTHLLDDTDYLNIVSATNDGARKKANLQLLVSYAAAYCETAEGHLGGFLKYLRSLPEGSLAAAKAGGGEKCVRIMSMHASKGLQFPICIIANTVTSMHNQGTKQRCVFSEDWGFGLRYYDEMLSKKCDNLGFRVINSVHRDQRLEEELRLLYVAMTRAEERLVIVSSENDIYEHASKLAVRLMTGNSSVGAKAFASASSMSEWILMTALLHPDCAQLRNGVNVSLIPIPTDSRMSLSILNSPDIAVPVVQAAEENMLTSDAESAEDILCNLNYTYPYSPLRTVEAKSTVSLLANKAESEKFAFSAKPSFMQKNGMSAAKRGTAMHKTMQFIRFDKTVDVAAELERLTEWQFISQADADACDASALNKFFSSSVYSRIIASREMHREMRFLTEVPAGRVEPSLESPLAEESVMVQGAVDLVFEEDDGLVILDFKTDRVNDPSELIEAYSEQLMIYSKACEKIFRRSVKEHIIYSFALGEAIYF